jgi:UDP-N-acetylglucosamine diphosphorylase/glucosamine-1-phosphate N-acetyltransferase
VSLAQGKLTAAKAWQCDGRIAAVVLAREVSVDELRTGRITLESLVPPGAGIGAADVTGVWIDHVWDFIASLTTLLTQDILHLSADMKPAKVDGSGGKKPPVFVEPDAAIETHTYFDTHAGPVYVARGASVQAFTRIVGPCYIGAESQVLGERIAAASIGDVCKVHGEVNSIVMLGHANKGHDGFVGHSYLGRWVNLGAGTITSNLKNTYGPVHLWTPSGERDTGMQFLGTMFGDHAKTAIGTRLVTGCVLGAGANVFGSAMMPKVVAPFAWGETGSFQTYRVDKFLESVERMMARREQFLRAGMRAQLERAHAQRWSAGS